MTLNPEPVEIWGHVWAPFPDPERIDWLYRCQYCGKVTKQPYFETPNDYCPVDTQKARDLVLAVTRP